MSNSYSVVIPAFNEENAIDDVLRDLRSKLSGREFEIIIVDDCSSDATAARARAHREIRVLSNVQNSGYGYSLKRGIKEAKNENIIIMDADGSYPVSALLGLIEKYEKGFDMIVGARQGMHYRGSQVKRIARICFRMLSEFATGRRIPDINSGCRIFRRDVAMSFFHTLSSGFSFTTTITLAFMLNSFSVLYVPIEYHKRQGHSKVKYFRDTLRAAQIIVEAIVVYNPLKIFILCGGAVVVAGIVSFIIAAVGLPLLGLYLFMVSAFSILIFSLGLLATQNRFSYARSVNHA